ncbi:hypothetical protein LIMHP_15665 [Leptospira interrogans serovar Manilae]|nr:hypothetical protein LIMLP_15675 [Leptospira interrogans serovar Manilae]AKP30993.1 hypothetical protein LIMHP_15665 [Leptospira interrogans serovar Manilae]
MDRRSGLKKAHFSSVPTRMSLFTCKKYVFLIEKNFPNLTTFTHPKIGKTQHNALYESRCEVGTKFYRGFVVIPTDDQILVGGGIVLLSISRIDFFQVIQNSR